MTDEAHEDGPDERYDPLDSALGGRDINDPASFRQDCPYCGGPCDCDTVHNGVGLVQCGPFHCEACGASEIGPCDDKRVLSEDERRTGWYAPGSEPGSGANVIGGRIVGHKEMERAYRDRFEGNPRWHEPGAVEAWFEGVRRKPDGEEAG